jgi:hypothetical protein
MCACDKPEIPSSQSGGLSIMAQRSAIDPNDNVQVQYVLTGPARKVRGKLTRRDYGRLVEGDVLEVNRADYDALKPAFRLIESLPSEPKLAESQSLPEPSIIEIPVEDKTLTVFAGALPHIENLPGFEYEERDGD